MKKVNRHLILSFILTICLVVLHSYMVDISEIYQVIARIANRITIIFLVFALISIFFEEIRRSN